MAEFQIGEARYRANPFDADVHIALMLKLAPTFTALMGVAAQAASLQADKLGGDAPELILHRMSELAMPVSRELAALSDAAQKEIINACLEAAEQLVEDRWFRVRSPSGVISNKDNTGFSRKLQITLAVLRQNFGDMLRSMGVDLDILLGSVGGVQS